MSILGDDRKDLSLWMKRCPCKPECVNHLRVGGRFKHAHLLKLLIDGET